MQTHLTAAILALAIAAPALAQQTPILDGGPQGWQTETVAEGLDYPWDIVADGDRLVLADNAPGLRITADFSPAA